MPKSPAAYHDDERWLYTRDDSNAGDIYFSLHRASDFQFLANIYGDEKRARLISAAPELLAATEAGLDLAKEQLQLILEAHCLLDDQLEPRRDTLEDGVRDIVEQMEKKIAQMQAAIAKAKAVP